MSSHTSGAGGSSPPHPALGRAREVTWGNASTRTSTASQWGNRQTPDSIGISPPLARSQGRGDSGLYLATAFLPAAFSAIVGIG